MANPERGNLASRVNLNWILFAVALAALIPRISLGLSQFVAYDGYWHVFTATQDRWANMVLEYKGDAHPLLYYVVLHWVAFIGHSPIVYRSLSILPGAASAFLMGKIAEKVCVNRAVPVLAAVAYAFAITSIDLSIDVRSYMGCLFFVLLSFYFFLDVLTFAGVERVRPWILFALWVSIAIGFEYYALIYLAACLGVVALLLVFDSAYRSRLIHGVLLNLRGFAAVVLIPVLTIGYFYRTHLSRQMVSFDHLARFYWHPASGETRTAFLLSNLTNAFGYFLPIRISNAVFLIGVLAIFTFLLAVFAFTEKDRTKALRYRAVLLIPILLLLQLMILGLARKYPFGGEMRQQSILAPFLGLSLFLLLDRLISATPSVGLRRAALAAAAMAVAYSAYFQWNAYPRLSEELFTNDYREFLAFARAPDSIYLDQFSLIAYYIHTHQWDWHSRRRQDAREPFEEFQAGAPHGRSFEILRDRFSWNLDFTAPAAYETIARGLRDFQWPSLTVFHLQQMGLPLPPGSDQQHWEQVQNLAGPAGLKVTALRVQGADFFATFEPLTTGERPPP